MRRPLRIAVTAQLERASREAGFDTYLLPELPNRDFHRSLPERIGDGAKFMPFLEKNDIDLILDFNTEALTLSPSPNDPKQAAMTNAIMGIPYVACYLDPITSTMANASWLEHWQLLESPDWIKWIPETAHADELKRLGVPNVVTMPMAVNNDDFDTSPPEISTDGPTVAFMGHPASTWFKSNQTVTSNSLFSGFTAAALTADLPGVPFHKIFYDLYDFGEPLSATDDFEARANKAIDYYNKKFSYNAYLAVKQRDRFARFLHNKLGDAFELVGDHWGETYGLKHKPRIWDMKELHDRMRRVPICLNLIKGNWECGLIVRHFEITGYGGFMLTYETSELSNCFEIGKECDVFHNEADLLEKIEYYTDHPKERMEIARAGQDRTLKEHLFSHRIETLVQLLTKAGTLPKKPMIQKTVSKSSDVVVPESGSLPAIPIVVPPSCPSPTQ